jgi:membrane protein implicated in regulation of membrane protease activity
MMAASFVAIGVARWPLVWTLVLLAPASIVLAWWWSRR